MRAALHAAPRGTVTTRLHPVACARVHVTVSYAALRSSAFFGVSLVGASTARGAAGSTDALPAPVAAASTAGGDDDDDIARGGRDGAVDEEDARARCVTVSAAVRWLQFRRVCLCRLLRLRRSVRVAMRDVPQRRWEKTNKPATRMAATGSRPLPPCSAPLRRMCEHDRSAASAAHHTLSHST